MGDERLIEVMKETARAFGVDVIYPRIVFSVANGTYASNRYDDEDFFIARCIAEPEYRSAQIEYNRNTPLDDLRNVVETVAHECIHLMSWREQAAATTCARNDAEREFVRIAIEDTVDLWTCSPIIQAIIDAIVEKLTP